MRERERERERERGGGERELHIKRKIYKKVRNKERY